MSKDKKSDLTTRLINIKVLVILRSLAKISLISVLNISLNIAQNIHRIAESLTRRMNPDFDLKRFDACNSM